MTPSRIALAGALALATLFGSAIAVSAQDARPVRTWSFTAAIDFVVPKPAVCPAGPDPDAGRLQFSRPDYVTDETVGALFVEVTRTGGSTGAVSASVITSDDSAVAGADYTAVSTTVRFEDGDTSPRMVEIPIFQDQVAENAESFDVSLLDPNCVTFGGGHDFGNEVAIRPDGRIEAAVDAANGGDFALSRALP